MVREKLGAAKAADLIDRDEFEAVKAMAAAARDENDLLKARIQALEAKLGAGGTFTTPKRGKNKGA